MISIRNAKRQRLFFIAVACVVFPATVVLSLLPVEGKSALHTRGRFHSLGHVLIFGLLAYVAGRTTRSLRMRIALFAGMVLFGLGVEVAEHVLYGTAMEWNDVLVDALGVVVGTLLAFASTSTDGGLSAE